MKSLGETGPKGKMTHGQSLEMIRRWFIEEEGENQRFLWDQDRAAVDWLQQQVDVVRAEYNQGSSGSSAKGSNGGGMARQVRTSITADCKAFPVLSNFCGTTQLERTLSHI